ALRKGLVLDEFHSYFHATRTSFGAFFDTLLADNHPPLSFLVLHAAQAVLGDGALALRAPAIVFGLFEIVLAGQLARRLPSAGGRIAALAMALLAASSLHLDFSTQARMYALHATCVTGLTLALHTLATTNESARSASVLLVLWSVLGFHNHYFFVQYATVAGVATLAVVALTPALRSRLRRFVLPVVATVLLCLPWLAWGFRHQWTHALPPGGDDAGLKGLLEAFVHLFFLNVRLGGPELRMLFIGCGAAAAACGALSALRLLATSREPAARALAVLLTATAFGVPLLAAVAASSLGRAGFTWHYVLPSAAALAVLLADFACAAGPLVRVRRAIVGVIGASALLLSVLHVTSRGTEDYPGAVEHVLATHRPGDAIVSVEWQPALFPQGQPWDYYAPRLAQGSPPPRARMSGFSVADPRDLAQAERVLVLRTSLPGDQHLMQLLLERFEVASRADFGFGVEVLEFVPRED
ncbi:MAG: glycosyltransferase family 39 protein, partial [Planctomycetota bacterium]|nr:glycosyltransferase family 39 protein [Planctomycetota bacterium]